MYELVKVGDISYYVSCPSKIGIVKLSEREVCLIDSGNNRDAGKRVKKILDAEGWTLSAIYNTHFHADHIGANKYLSELTGAAIYAPGVDCALTRHTILEPVTLFGGAPPAELCHRFLLAEESQAEYLTRDNVPSVLEPISLPGHSFDMVGFRVEDGTVFIADALASREVLDKYGIFVVYDVGEYLKSLETLKTLEGKIFVPSHIEPTEDISSLIDCNVKKIYEVAEKIEWICREPKSHEQILAMLFSEYSLKMTVEQYALVGSTVRSYISWLRGLDRLELIIEENRLLFKAK